MDSTNPPTTKVLNNASTWSWVTNYTFEDMYFYKAQCYYNGVFSDNTTLRNWTYDVSSPIISLGTGIGFDGNVFNANYNFTDNIDLYAYIINISGAGTDYYGSQGQNLSGTSFDYVNPINFLGNPINVSYNSTITVKDSHTALKIDNYDVVNNDNTIEFLTSEKNVIRITIEFDDISNKRFILKET
jgi:hypothetical protein